MSVVFVVAPVVVAGWPVLCGAIAAAAGTLGYTSIKASQSVELDSGSDVSANVVEIALDDSQVVAETMARESQFTIHKDDMVATFSRLADGRCNVHVSSDSKTEAELNAAGRELIGRVTQQYAYNKVITELRQQGFTVTDEEITNDQAIRIHVAKYV